MGRGEWVEIFEHLTDPVGPLAGDPPEGPQHPVLRPIVGEKPISETASSAIALASLVGLDPVDGLAQLANQGLQIPRAASQGCFQGRVQLDHPGLESGQLLARPRGNPLQLLDQGTPGTLLGLGRPYLPTNCPRQGDPQALEGGLGVSIHQAYAESGGEGRCGALQARVQWRNQDVSQELAGTTHGGGDR